MHEVKHAPEKKTWNMGFIVCAIVRWIIMVHATNHLTKRVHAIACIKLNYVYNIYIIYTI